jgi:hypothetical protein
MSRRALFGWSCVALLVTAGAWLGSVSSSFEKCSNEHRYNAEADSSEGAQKSLISKNIRLFVRCEGAFLDANSVLITGIATIAIAGFTLNLWLAATEQAKLTRASIELASEEFISSHRPRMILRDIYVVSGKNGHEIIYVLVNNGGTKGTIVESRITTEGVPPNQSIRNLRSYGYNDLGQIIFASGEMKELTYEAPTDVDWHIIMTSVTRRDRTDEEKAWTLYFVGSILYSDDAGNRRESVFRRRWDRHREAFVRVDDPDQDYVD